MQGQEKLKFQTVIAEQEKTLEQLKIQEKLGEVLAQEAVYQKAVDDEDIADDFQSPLLPTTEYDPTSAFLSGNAQGLMSTPEAVPSVSQNLPSFPTASASPIFTSPPQFTVSSFSSPQTTVGVESQTPETSSSKKPQDTIYSSTHTRFGIGT